MRSRPISGASKECRLYRFWRERAEIRHRVGLSPETIGIRSFGRWSPFTYLVIFTLGYILATDARYRPVIARLRFVSLGLALFLASISFIIIMFLYEFVAKRVASLRLLFGMQG